MEVQALVETRVIAQGFSFLGLQVDRRCAGCREHFRPTEEIVLRNPRLPGELPWGRKDFLNRNSIKGGGPRSSRPWRCGRRFCRLHGSGGGGLAPPRPFGR